MADRRQDHEQDLTERERAEFDQLWTALRGGAGGRHATRRDLLRWSTIAAGAVATARAGVGVAPSGVLAAPGRQDAEIVQGAEIVVPFDAFGQAVTLDPHRSADYGGFWVMYPNVWGGLLRYDEMGRVVQDLAESFVVSDDGLVYTFKIRPDARFANGRPVTGPAFVRSWVRALDPTNPSPMAIFMQHVKGVQDFLNRTEGAQLGFRAPDDATVEIELSQPASFFPSYLASFVWAVVDPEVIEQAGQENFVLNDAGTGPWRFADYELDVQFVMEPNPNYYGGVSPSLARIVWPILTGPTAAREALDRYINDEAVSADVPLSLKAEVEADAILSQDLRRLDVFPGTTRSLAMDFRQPPFDDVRVRRAFGLAIDRNRYLEIYQGTWSPASVFTPPVVWELAGYQPPDGLEFNPDEARALLAEAGFPNGEGLPPIIYYHPAGDSPEEMDRVRAVLQMFLDNLGVTIEMDDTKSLQQIADLTLDLGGRQFDLIWWQNVTETPHLLTEVFHPDSPYMRGVFNWATDLPAVGGFDPAADAAAFVDLAGRADQERDPATRNDLYRQAEELALKNAVYVPIANWIPMYVQKPWLQGTKQGTWTGRLPVLFDAEVVVVAH